MSDDYLWDRTGEPDPEIQQLEQVLGTLRYQPRPLELPVELRSGHRRTFLPRMAIAAAVATMLVGGAWWLGLHRQNTSVRLGSASKLPPVESAKIEPDTVTPAKDAIVDSSIASGTPEKKQQRNPSSETLLAEKKQFRRFKARGTELSARDRAEAQAAKEQLLLALRVASAKLSLAQKKAQSGYPGGLIRNQHKVG